MNIISIQNICKSFGEKKVFDGFNLEIEQGEFVCVMGASGSGKSTLLNMIGMIEKPDAGNIQICGFTNPKLNSRQGVYLLRNEISHLFQNYGLLDNETIYYNLKIVADLLKLKRKEKRVVIKNALETVGMYGRETEKVYCLSGGEQQRVALAKCILKPSSIILADEPTGSLDERNKEMVMEIVRNMNQSGKTIILVTHDISIKKYASKVLWI